MHCIELRLASAMMEPPIQAEYRRSCATEQNYNQVANTISSFGGIQSVMSQVASTDYQSSISGYVLHVAIVVTW